MGEEADEMENVGCEGTLECWDQCCGVGES